MHALQDLLHHLVANYLGLCKPRLKEGLCADEALLPRLEMAQTDTLGPSARGKCKLQVVAAVRLVVHRRVDGRVQNLRVAEEVLRHTKAQTEQRRAAQHMIIRHNT